MKHVIVTQYMFKSRVMYKNAFIAHTNTWYAFIRTSLGYIFTLCHNSRDYRAPLIRSPICRWLHIFWKMNRRPGDATEHVLVVIYATLNNLL